MDSSQAMWSFCCYANSEGNQRACWQFFVPSSYECLLLWSKLFTIRNAWVTAAKKIIKNPQGSTGSMSGKCLQFPFWYFPSFFGGFYVTFINSENFNRVSVFFVFIHIHKFKCGPIWELCSTTWAWRLKALLGQSLLIVAEGDKKSIAFNIFF